MPFLVFSDLANYVNIGNIAIYFLSKQCSGQPSDTVPPGYLSTQAIPNKPGALTETVKDTCLAYYNTITGLFTNQSVLDTLTTQFALDFSNWRQITFDYTFEGIVPIQPNALIMDSIFDYRRGSCMTRVIAYPLNFDIQELGHFDYSDDCQVTYDTDMPNFDGSPYIYFYGPPGGCTAMVSGGSPELYLTRWGLILTDGRLSEKYISTDMI